MKHKIKRIYLAWRTGKSHRRIIIGEVKHSANSTTFHYFPEAVEEAKGQGFLGYPDFSDFNKVYDRNILQILSRRINDNTRTDIKDYYDFWHVPQNEQSNPIAILAYTEGILPTDNFEFLADFYSIKGLTFVTELAGLSQHEITSETLTIGDTLTWKKEPENEYDKAAVAIYKGTTKIGYIKQIHNRIFHHKNQNINVTVHHVDANGHINRAFLLIRVQ